jgi:hypothetical protein
MATTLFFVVLFAADFNFPSQNKKRYRDVFSSLYLIFLFSFLLFAKALENVVASVCCPNEKENIGCRHQLGLLSTIARSKMDDHKYHDSNSYCSHENRIDCLQYIILHNSIY